ncbi:MAG: hypothetical protein ACK4QL_01415 [Pseudanabaenaceae cyanobacterium]
MKNYYWSGLVVSLLLLPTAVFGQGAPGAVQRCEAAKNACLERAVNAGQADRCGRVYLTCVNRAEQAGSNYRRCMASARSDRDRSRCRANYQAERF